MNNLLEKLASLFFLKNAQHLLEELDPPQLFPRPDQQSRESIEQHDDPDAFRLGVAPGSELSEAEIAHFRSLTPPNAHREQRRVDALMEELTRIAESGDRDAIEAFINEHIENAGER